MVGKVRVHVASQFRLLRRKVGEIDEEARAHVSAKTKRVRDQRSTTVVLQSPKAHSLLHLVALLGVCGFESLDEQLAVLEQSSAPDLLRVDGLDQTVLEMEQGLEIAYFSSIVIMPYLNFHLSPTTRKLLLCNISSSCDQIA